MSRQRIKEFTPFSVVPPDDVRLTAESLLRIMDEHVQKEMAEVDSWCLLMTARHEVLPEETRDRCILARKLLDYGMEYILFVDSRPVEKLVVQYTIGGQLFPNALPRRF